MIARRRSLEVDPRQILGHVDLVLLLCVLTLTGFGVVMVFSASGVASIKDYSDKFHFLKLQLLWTLLGLGSMVFFTFFDYRRLKKAAPWLLAAAVALLLLCFVPGVGVFVRGARRWVSLGLFRITPSELARWAVVIYLAAFLSSNLDRNDSVRDFLLPALGVCALVFALIMKQPDLSSAFMVAASGMLLVAVSYRNFKHLVLAGLVGMLAVGALVVSEPYRFRRVTAFLDPWKDPDGSGYHVIQSMVALGSGGAFGRGLGKSWQKFKYLPDEHTDFIFAIVGEELGFAGATVVVLAYMVLLWRGLRISRRAVDPFGRLLAFGIAASIALQALINVAVVTGSLPTTGIVLPFISYGGTSLVLMLTMCGVLLNISMVAEREKYKRVREGWKEAVLVPAGFRGGR